MIKCILCQNKIFIHQNTVFGLPRSYHFCNHCFILFMTRNQLLSVELECERYNLHENKDTDGYRNFYRHLVNDFLENVCSLENVIILDYGCGPGQEPLLKKIILEKLKIKNKNDFQFDLYDPFFCPNDLTKKYDFIFSTEVIEHVNEPSKYFEKLTSLLRPKGKLYLMTSLYPLYADHGHQTKAHPDWEKFENWSYRRDPTHVAFYSIQTFHEIALKYKMKFSIISENTFKFELI